MHPTLPIASAPTERVDWSCCKILIGMAGLGVDIVRRAKCSIDVALLEAQTIQARRPTLNRRHELICL